MARSTSCSVPEIAVVERQPQTGDAPSQVSYRNLSLTGLADGVLAHQEVGPVTIAAHVSSPDEFNFAVDKVEIDRTDLGAMAHILDETQYRDGSGDNVWRPLMSRAVYRGVSGKGVDAANFRIDEIAVENIDGRQPEKPFTDRLGPDDGPGRP